MTTIYLIRHAEAEGNLYRIAQGQYDSAVTDRGWRQIAALERRFREIPVDAVYSSDLRRAVATAEAVSRPRGLSVREEPELREIHVGEWEQRTWGEIARSDPVELEHFNHAMHLLRIKGGERPQAAQSRVLQAIRRIAEENHGKTAAVVSHGAVLRMALCWYQGDTLENLGKYPHGDNTAVSCLLYDKGKFKIIFRDDNSHLRTPDYLSHEKVRRRAVAVEPGLRFRHAPPLEQTDAFARLFVQIHNERGEGETKSPCDIQSLISRSLTGMTLLGYHEDDLTGLISFKPETGEIIVLHVLPEFRRRGYGGQYLGQATQYCRAHGVDFLRTRRDPRSAAFFADYGFRADIHKPETLTKDITVKTRP